MALWIVICIVVGLLVERHIPEFGQFLDLLKLVKLSIPMGILLFFMMYSTVVDTRFSDIEPKRKLKV